MKTNQHHGAICQSCGAPLQHPGTNTDGSTNQDYCNACYKDGSFLEPNITMQEQINKVAGYMTKYMDVPEAEAKAQAESFIPTLKRWENNAG